MARGGGRRSAADDERYSRSSACLYHVDYAAARYWPRYAIFVLITLLLPRCFFIVVYARLRYAIFTVITHATMPCHAAADFTMLPRR